MNQKQVDELLKTLIDENAMVSKPKEVDSLKKGVREMIMMANATRVIDSKSKEKDNIEQSKKST